MAAAKVTPLVAGNWKMNGLAASAGELTKIIAGAKALAGKAELMVCPPATLIAAFAAAATRLDGDRWGAGLSCRSVRRTYRRYFGGDAG